MKKIIIVILINQFTGCATIMNGSRQRIAIATDPVEATVKADGGNDKACWTPCTMLLSRRTAHTLTFKKDGYEIASSALDSSASGWLWGNIFLGGPIGLIIDLASGAAWKLEPGNIEKELKKK